MGGFKPTFLTLFCVFQVVYISHWKYFVSTFSKGKDHSRKSLKQNQFVFWGLNKCCKPDFSIFGSVEALKCVPQKKVYKWQTIILVKTDPVAVQLKRSWGRTPIVLLWEQSQSSSLGSYGKYLDQGRLQPELNNKINLQKTWVEAKPVSCMVWLSSNFLILSFCLLYFVVLWLCCRFFSPNVS